MLSGGPVGQGHKGLPQIIRDCRLLRQSIRRQCSQQYLAHGLAGIVFDVAARSSLVSSAGACPAQRADIRLCSH